MKKINMLLIGFFVLLFAPSYVNATVSANISVSCNNVVVGSTTTCVVRGTAVAGEVTGIEASFGISPGATIESVSAASGWDVLSNSTTNIYYTAGASNLKNTFDIATLNVRGTQAGTISLRVYDIKINDENYSTISLQEKSTSFAATNPVAQTPTQNAKPKVTQKPQVVPQSSTTTTIAAPTELKLDSVTVGDFEVTYNEGKYYATVNYDTESVEVTATANPNITIIGQGLRTLTTGKNIVELILRNEAGQSASIQVVITKPEDTNDYSTYLTSLKVVDYKLDFNRDVNEYTLYVPSTVKELYVIAESDNVDVSIMGAGLQTLKSGNNDLYIRVQYGTKATNEYIIHVKRSYNSVIMLVAIGLLSASLIGFGVFYYLKQKKNKILSVEEKNKILAEANRTVASSKENAQLNGQSVVTPRTIDVAPTQVTEVKVPTNPVTVATSAVKPQVAPQVAPQQVRVVTTNPQPTEVRQVNTGVQPHQIVINTGEIKNNQ